MDKPMSELSQKEFIVEMLTLQYIQGKAGDSAAEYVKLYQQAKDEIKSAYEKGNPFELKNMI